MGILGWTAVWVVITFSIYIGIAIWSRVADTRGFYVASQGVPAVANGMAVGADWMSAASFISLAGIVSFIGFDGSVYLMGWTGGYVLLALLLAPYLRKFGEYTVPDFVARRYYSKTARVVAAVAALFVSFTYVAGQMRGVGVVFSRFLGDFLAPFATAIGVEVVTIGVTIGMIIVALYAVLGGMKGVTWTQVAQYCVLIIAYLIPAVAIAAELTGNPIPQGAIGDVVPVLNQLSADLGLDMYTGPFSNLSMLNVFCITFVLMAGTAGLPHVIVRFYTVKTVRDARWSAFWAIVFIGILYTVAPAIAMFSRLEILQSFNELGAQGMAQQLGWVQNWTQAGLIESSGWTADTTVQQMLGGIDRDIIVLATPELAGLSAWVVGLVAAGGLAAALSTASGLMIVISSSLAHDIYGEVINPDASEQKRLRVGRQAIFVGVIVAGLAGIYPPGFVAEVVAFAFGLAAASFFPILVLGIFWKRCNRQGAVAGMIAGLTFTFVMIVLMRIHIITRGAIAEPFIDSFLGINAQGIGIIGMLINFALTIGISLNTPAPPQKVQDLVEQVRYPRELTPDELKEAVAEARG
ncbi:cation acetate symporter [Longibacter salinarum]|uniref:Cation acetate symporter n=1 Tax=Longibacter salinarum TaxID=1850348 RepID=A0A2A8CWA6_9BACT|nr:sodium:solute symporter family protein [Longibacter salinarum]PEN12874.1 cation acetate symporter [Longibacter salinarum]